MNQDIYIYHHLGLGDHILCNAIIRNYAKCYKKIYCFVKDSNYENVSFMLRDLTNIFLIKINSINDITFFMKINPTNKYLIIGHTREYFHKFNNKIYESFDDGFYKMCNIPLQEKWDKFYLQRNIEHEKHIFYNVFNLTEEEKFVFVHQDLRRNIKIDYSYISKDCRIIYSENYKNLKIFDFLYTIEKAEEVHVIGSAFYCLLDTIQIKTKKLFLHEYARKDMGIDTNENTASFLKYKMPWIIIKK